MTRINIVPVDELMDQHLIAEYREITMVPAALNRTLKSKKLNNLRLFWISPFILVGVLFLGQLIINMLR